MKKSLILLVLFVMESLIVSGQRSSTRVVKGNPEPESKSIKISAPGSIPKSRTAVEFKEPKSSYWAVGLIASTNSSPIAGITLKNTYGKNPLNLSILSVDFVNVNDYRQFKSPYAYTGGAYIEGKLNYLFVLRPSFGKEIAFLQAADDTSPSLKGFFSSGPAIGFQTPYYVQISRNIGPGSDIITIPYSDIFANVYTNPSIVGAGSWFNGIADAKLMPGWHLKGGVNLDYRNFKGNYFGIEIGANVDFFAKEINQLYNTKGRNFYSGAYICMYFGKSHR